MTKIPEHVKCLDVTRIGSADCQHCAIRKYDILADVDVAKYDRLLKNIIQFHHAKKSVVFNQGAKGEAVFVVRRGLVKLEEIMSDGDTRIVRIARKGEVVGLEAFLENGESYNYDQTATALEDTEVCRIPHSVLNNLLDNEPGFYKTVMKEWHHQIEATNQVIVEFSTGTIKKRLAAVFMMLVEEAKKHSENQISLMLIDDLASLTGVTRESVSRVLSEFKRQDILTKTQNGKAVINENVLREIAEI